MSGDDYRDRVLGSLLGGAIGDALGAPVEFWSRERIVATVGHWGVREYLPTRFGDAHGTGLITDDTQMTLFTMEGLVAAYERGRAKGIGFAMPWVHQAYVRWYRTQVTSSPPDNATATLADQQWLYSRRASGNTCLSALRVVAEDPAPQPLMLGQRANNDSKGCGSVMRAAPFGWIPCDRSDLEHWVFPGALEVAGYTHGHPTGQVSAAALAVLIYELIWGADLKAAVNTSIEAVQQLPEAQETVDALTTAIHLAEQEPGDEEALTQLGEGWIAEQALAIAIYAALSYPQQDQVLDALSLSVSHTGDSDSTGSICGNILGAAHGHNHLPEPLLDQLEGQQFIRQCGEDFVTTFARLHASTSSHQ